MDDWIDAYCLVRDHSACCPLRRDAQRSPDARSNENLFDTDETLFELARTLALEGADGYPNEPHHWNDIADSVVCRLVARHGSDAASSSRGLLDKTIFARVALVQDGQRWLGELVRGRNENSNNVHDRQSRAT